MARKVVELPITADGRDKGKIFVLTEMPATQAELWATRCLLALSRAGVEIDEQILESGMLGFANLSLKLFGAISFEEARVLLAEMFTCVQIKPSPIDQPMIVRPLIETDIEEVMTRLKIRMELIVLHTGFSIPGVQSTAIPATPLF